VHPRVDNDDIKRGQAGEVKPENVLLGRVKEICLKREVPRELDADVLLAPTWQDGEAL